MFQIQESLQSISSISSQILLPLTILRWWNAQFCQKPFQNPALKLIFLIWICGTVRNIQKPIPSSPALIFPTKIHVDSYELVSE
jgi:hypothetical protein